MLWLDFSICNLFKSKNSQRFGQLTGCLADDSGGIFAIGYSEIYNKHKKSLILPEDKRDILSMRPNWAEFIVYQRFQNELIISADKKNLSSHRTFSGRLTEAFPNSLPK